VIEKRLFGPSTLSFIIETLSGSGKPALPGGARDQGRSIRRFDPVSSHGSSYSHR
jgi:hypothetical protein